MIELIEEPWPALERLCNDHDAKRLDILTGYLGKGASQALAALGVRARIVMGLESEDAALSVAQIEEIRALLAASHEVRWLNGLHAKLYLVEQRAVLVGSANFTRAGFELLEEVGIATDDAAVVARAISLFEERFGQAAPIAPDRLRAHESPTVDDDEHLGHGLGEAWEDRHSGFSRAPSIAASPSSGSDSHRPAVENDGRDDGAVVVNFDRDDFMYMNIAEGPHRCWADCRRYGFLSAGQGARWSTQLGRLNVGAPIYAYFKAHGYVGIGVVDGTPRMASEHVVAAEGKKLFDLPLLQPGLRSNAGDPAHCEWIVPVRWYRTRASHEAVGYGLFSSQLVACRLRDPTTLQVLRSVFEHA